MSENALLSGYLESTNEPYAISKIAGIKLCEAITGNMAWILEVSCLLICMVQAIIIIPSKATYTCFIETISRGQS